MEIKGLRDIGTLRGQRCPYCNGSGINQRTRIRCPHCNGTGFLTRKGYGQ